MRVRSLSDPIERGHDCRKNSRLSRRVKSRRCWGIVPLVRRVQDKCQADAGVVASRGIRSPIVPVACRSALTSLFEELDAVDRHVFRRGGIRFDCRAYTRIPAFLNMDLNILFKEVGPCCEWQIDTARVI